jgi:oligoribonuclease
VADTPPTLVWIDLEMTGLDPETCNIVQLAMILTDTQLNRLTQPIEINIWQPESVLAAMTPFVRDMHEKTGLIAKVRASKVSLQEAERTVLEIISAHCAYRTPRLCGNSVWQDRRFLAKYMPLVESFFHYRQIDVSTIKEMMHWWKNIRYEKPEDAKHTALQDIQQSIEELKFYRTQLNL